MAQFPLKDFIDGTKQLATRLYGPNGQVISELNPMPVTITDSTVDMATETTLAQSVDKLNSILSRLEGKLSTAIFDSQGNAISSNNRLPVDVDLSDVTVQISEVQQGKRGTNAEPWEVTLTGRLLHSHENLDIFIPILNIGVNTNTTFASTIPVDTSGYKDVALIIDNTTNAAIDLTGIQVHGVNATNTRARHTEAVSKSIPSGATAYIWYTEYEILRAPKTGISIRLNTSVASEGSYSIWFVGGAA